jgi:hypothetical protein
MNPQPQQPRLRITSLDGVLAVVPHLLGFHPASSLVVLGTAGPRRQIRLAFRYDLPDPPDPSLAAEIAGHAAAVLRRQHITTAIIIGYGPGSLVTPLADAARQIVPRAGLELRDFLRVQDGRYWSYVCREPSCCPAEGVPFDTAAHPAAAALAAVGPPVLAGRAALAATIAPLTGAGADAMRQATRRAERAAARLLAHHGPHALDGPGLAAVKAAIGVYRQGGSISSAARHARLAVVLTSLRIRDDAWARMDPQHRDAHRRLWADLVRRAQPGYAAAPASLLAFTAWQSGDGALANIALDRALADTPGYSMALLLRDAVAAGFPPSKAVLPRTPEEVAASYAERDGSHPPGNAGPDAQTTSG